MKINYLKSPSGLTPMLFKIYSMGIVKRRIFVHGVKYYKGNLLDEFWQYDIHLNFWLNINKEDNMPFGSSALEIVVVHKLLYFIYGEHNSLNAFQITIENFDSEKNTWEFLTNLQRIHDHHNYSLDSLQSMFHYNNSLYVIAKMLGDRSFNIILQYSLLEKYWSVIEPKGDLLKVMDGISGSVYDNKYYCFGDMKIFTTDIYHEIHIFDLKTYLWSHKATYPDFDQYPSDRIHASISFNQTHGFLSGGQSQCNEILDDLWSIDLRTLKWHKFNFKLDCKIMKHKSAIYDESSLFIFGVNIDSGIANQLQKYVIEPPSLYKLCLYVFMKSNKEESEFKSIPLHIKQDIITPQGEFLLSEETNDLF